MKTILTIEDKEWGTFIEGRFIDVDGTTIPIEEVRILADSNDSSPALVYGAAFMEALENLLKKVNDERERKVTDVGKLTEKGLLRARKGSGEESSSRQDLGLEVPEVRAPEEKC